MVSEALVKSAQHSESDAWMTQCGAGGPTRRGNHPMNHSRPQTQVDALQQAALASSTCARINQTCVANERPGLFAREHTRGAP